jgi:cyclophilin family peptidyl-prolyl cis-trans isomerase
MRTRFLFLLLAVMFLAGCSSSDELLRDAEKQDITSLKETQKAKEAIETNQKQAMHDKAPAMTLDTKKKYQAVMSTDKGDMTIELFASATPITVNNFVFLAKEGFYDNTVFHRVVKDFMIQGGDPTGTGSGGPGYKFNDEKFEGEYTRGTVAMANAGPNTNGSQFFIVQKDVALPKNYVIFGKVVAGLDVVDAIGNAEVSEGRGGEMSSPKVLVKITKVTINEE